jgi:hypothetical protein
MGNMSLVVIFLQFFIYYYLHMEFNMELILITA